MASLLRSGGVSKLFSGFRRVLASQSLRYEPLTLHRPQGQSLCPSVIRLLSAQRPAESAASPSSSSSQGIDRALYRIDTDIRRTGRIFIRDVEDIFNEIKTLRHASSTQSLLLLRCCGSLVPEEQPDVRNKLVQDIWKTLHELGVPMDISHYNTLLRVYLENGHKFSPTDFLAQLEKNGVEPNRVTYQRLIARYCQEGDIEGSTKILEFMKEKQLPVGENIFNALITGHAKAKDLNSSWAVLEVMRSSGLEPTADSYAALLVSHAEAGDEEGLQRTLKACEAAELTMHDRDLLEAVLALATHEHFNLIPQVLDKLHRQQGYIHDAMNIIYRLVNAGCLETAHQVFGTIRHPQTSEAQYQTSFGGSFFIRHLVKSGTTPMTQVVELCQELKEKEINPMGMEIALNSALVSGRIEEAVFLMKVMKDEGHSLRPHYFWPIFLHHIKNGHSQKVYDSVKEMMNLNIPVTLETLRNYIIPGLVEKSQLGAEDIISGFKEAGISVPLVTNGLVAFLIDRSNLSAAVKLLSRYRVRLRASLRRDLADCYSRSGQTDAVVSILGQIISLPQSNVNTEKDDLVDEDEANVPREEKDPQDIAAMFLLDVCQTQRGQNQENFLALLEEMEKRGIGIGSAGRDAINERLPPDVDPATKETLERMCSGNLTFQPLPREAQEPYSQRSIKDLENRLLELQNKNLPTTVVENYLLLAYIKGKEVEKAETLWQRMEAEGLTFGAGVYVLLVDMYVGFGDLTKAVSILEKLMMKEPEVKLNPVKYLRLAHLMVQEGKAEDALQLIQQHIEEGQSSGGGSEEATVVHLNARRLLEVMVEQSGIELARNMLDLLLSHKVVRPSSALFTPIIKFYLSKDDLESAMKEFESVCQIHRATPMKQDLIQRCIKLEDGERLQKIMDLSIQVHGELNSLYDMVFAFVECGKMHQARKLIETPGLRALNMKLDQKCTWLRETGKVEELAGLVTVTKDIFDVDRDMMYSHLLKAYVQQNDPDKALGVWTTMQEDDHRPSEEFLIELGRFLESSGQKVPFTVPEKQPQLQEEEVTVPDAPPSLPSKKEFRKALLNRNWISALNLRNRMLESGIKLSIAESSELVEGLLKGSHLKEATTLVFSMVAANTHPVPRVFKYFLLALASAGEVEAMEALQKFITDNKLLRRLNYNNALSTSYIVAGRSLEMLEALTKSIKDTPDTGLQELSMSFPNGGLMSIMEKQPEHFPQVLEVSKQYAARGLISPMNCVWMHLFNMREHSQADQIYQEHLKNSSSMLMFRGILKHASRTADVTQLPLLMQVLEGHSYISTQAKGLVYTTWIDILSACEKFEEGKQVLETALKNLDITDISPGSLNRLKVGLEKAGKEFGYTIPDKRSREQRQTKDSASSSSSDTD